MKVGTKSLLFGVHQFVWHPITVTLAWHDLYGRWPSWKNLICIIVHDWGYWGKPNMDGPEGEDHPLLGAHIADTLFGWEYYILCLFHSRHYARKYDEYPSLLCWADKFSIKYEPWWLYLPRAWLSGELFEYRKVASDAGFFPLWLSHRDWFVWIKDRLTTLGTDMRGDAVPYVNPVRCNQDLSNI